MALGKPTVCFETKENIHTAGDAALYASNNDVSAFAECIVRLMDDLEMRSRMGHIARSRVDNGLTWHHQAEQLVALYDDLFGILRPGTEVAPDDHGSLQRDSTVAMIQHELAAK